MLPPAGVPRTVWQMPQCAMNSFLPLRQLAAICWRWGRLQLALPTKPENRRAICAYHGEAHVGVLLTAVFGALAAIHARFAASKPSFVVLAGNGIGLAGQRRYPEGMDDILAPQMSREPAGQWEYGSHSPFSKLPGHDFVLVANPPPPLMPSNFNREGSAPVRRDHISQHCESPKCGAE